MAGTGDPISTRLQESARTKNRPFEYTRSLRIREAVSFARGASQNEPVRHVVDTLPDGTEVVFLKPGKEAFRKQNPKPEDMTPVVHGYESAAFGDVWSTLARISVTDADSFRGLATLLYRVAYHIDHVADAGRVRYRPAPPVSVFISDLERRLSGLLPNGSAWALLHFLDVLGWNEDVKYHLESGRPTFKGKYTFSTGRVTTLLTSIRVPYEVARFAHHAAENASSPDRTDFGQIIDVMQQFSVARGTCVPSEEQLLEWLHPHLRE